MSSSFVQRLGLVAWIVAAGCSDEASSQAGLVGGTPTTHGEWPGLVALYRGAGYVCQGALVWPDIVVSASHCFQMSPPDTVIVGRDDQSTTAGTAYHIDGICHVDSANPRTCFVRWPMHDDLVLLHLDHPVPESEQRVVRLAIESELSSPSASAVGWGGPGPSLHSAVVRLQPPSACSRYAGTRLGITVCNDFSILTDGDSGGPLYVEVGGERALAGIVSLSSPIPMPGADFWERVPAYLNAIPGVVGPLSSLRWKRDACEGTMPVSPPAWRQGMAYALRKADLNGDGYDDLVAVTSTRIVSWLAGPAGAFSRTESPAPPGITDLFGVSAVVGEFDDVPGPDLAGVDPAAGYTLRVLGSRPTASGIDWVLSAHAPLPLSTFDVGRPADPAPLPSALWRARRLRAGDVNGDGFDDLVAVMNSRVRVLVNHGGTSWSTENPGLPTSLLSHDSNKRSTILLADVAPDAAGADELVVRETCGLSVRQRTPTGWSSIFAQPCGDAGSLDDANGWRAAPPDTPLRAGRFNGDACDDLLVRDRDRVRIFYSNCAAGAPLALTELPSGTLADWFDSFGGIPAHALPFFVGWEFWDGGLGVGDFDGDGRQDFVGHSPFGVEARLNAGDGTFRAADPLRPMFPEPFQLSNTATMLVGRFDGPAAPDRLLASHDVCLDVWELTSTPQPGTFHVLSPAANAEASFDFALLGDGHMKIEVIFSEPVDLASLIPGTNVILGADRDPNTAITIEPGASTSRIVITTDSPIGEFCDFTPNCFPRLSIIGSGPTPVRSVSGQTLDGDEDEIQGGDYVTAFLILG